MYLRTGRASQEGYRWMSLLQDQTGPDSQLLRGPHRARAGGHGDGKARRVPHRGRVLSCRTYILDTFIQASFNIE